jgi:2-hydroxychromene-2-carboxylate isomerase
MNVDLDWSFRSPYSYLATGRIVELAAEYAIDFKVRPVYPIAVRDEAFFERVNPLWPPYVFRDTVRIAERLNIPYHWPNPDPIVQDMESRKISKEQPYIYRLTKLGAAAAEEGDGLAFIQEVSSLIWTGTADWHEGEHLSNAASRAGFDLAKLDQAIVERSDHYHSLIEANQDALAEAGHWGVPCTVFEGEPFFGQDRLDDLLFRLHQQGLEKR